MYFDEGKKGRMSGHHNHRNIHLEPSEERGAKQLSWDWRGSEDQIRVINLAQLKVTHN